LHLALPVAILLASVGLSLPKQVFFEARGLASVAAHPSPSPAPVVVEEPAPSPPPPSARVVAAAPRAAAPASNRAGAPQPVGEIRIPKIGLVHPIYEGIDIKIIDRGPGHWPYTAMPGQVGNTVWPGHRVTHTHPFLRIGELVPGDEVIFQTADGTFTYLVTKTEFVYPKDTWVADQTSYPSMTILACHPPHSAKQRIVVRGRLQGY
jgi:sortase A